MFWLLMCVPCPLLSTSMRYLLGWGLLSRLQLSNHVCSMLATWHPSFWTTAHHTSLPSWCWTICLLKLWIYLIPWLIFCHPKCYPNSQINSKMSCGTLGSFARKLWLWLTSPHILRYPPYTKHLNLCVSSPLRCIILIVDVMYVVFLLIVWLLYGVSLCTMIRLY